VNILLSNKIFKHLFILLASLNFYVGLSFADDIEIYINKSSNLNVNPNILFVLDDSGSMTTRVTKTQSRIQVLKTVMNELLDEFSNINAGIMSFNAIFYHQLLILISLIQT